MLYTEPFIIFIDSLGFPLIKTWVLSWVAITRGRSVLELQFPLTTMYSSPTISTGILTLNLANGNVFDVALNANITTLTISNPPAANNAGSGIEPLIVICKMQQIRVCRQN